MIVQPAPIGPPSRSRRILRSIGVVVPLVLLTAVVGLGVLGPRPEPPVAPASPAAPAGANWDPAGSTPGPTPAGGSPGSGPAALAARQPPRYPSTIAGLPVRSVDETLAGRAAGDIRGLVAVAGHLGLRELPEACGDDRLGPFGAFCSRTGLLADLPWEADTGYAQLGTHLHPQFPVGVRIPHRVAEVARSGWAASAAVVIARFDDPRARRCHPVGRHCGEELVVERVAWVEGDDYPRTITVDPAIDPAPATTASLRPAARQAASHLPTATVVLLAALVRPGTITYIDPSMAPVVVELGPDPVWYVRGAALAAEPLAIEWVIADATGTELRRGSVPLVEG